VGTGYEWTPTKQRVIGVLLMLPFVGVIPVMVDGCHGGSGARNVIGRLTSNLYTLWFIAGLLGLVVGIRLIVLSFPRR